jgi:hypothetical protein
MKQSIEYVDKQLKEGDKDAYKQLNKVDGYEIEDELSPEAQTDLKLAEL